MIYKIRLSVLSPGTVVKYCYVLSPPNMVERIGNTKTRYFIYHNQEGQPAITTSYKYSNNNKGCFKTYYLRNKKYRTKYKYEAALHNQKYIRYKGDK